MASDAPNFDGLVAAIRQADAALAEQASRAVNVSLTLRNWFIGYHIADSSCKARIAPVMATSCWQSYPERCANSLSATPDAASFMAIWPFTAFIPR